MDGLLTEIIGEWTARLSDSVRTLAWSPQGRLLAVGADGRALVDDADRLTAPLCPDPLDAVWLGERRVAVVDAALGVVFAGQGHNVVRQVDGARLVGTSGGRTVIAGANTLTVFGHPDAPCPPLIIDTGVGASHALAHLLGNLWVVGGSQGLATFDVAWGCVDERLELAGVVALSGATSGESIVAGDLAGSIHVIDVADMADGVELTGYPDPVRCLVVTPNGATVVAAADDELTFWVLDEHSGWNDEPTRAVAHDATITALAVSPTGIVASGDASGTVHAWSAHACGFVIGTRRLDAEVTDLAWSCDGRRLACGTVSGQITVFDVCSGTVV